MILVFEIWYFSYEKVPNARRCGRHVSAMRQQTRKIKDVRKEVMYKLTTNKMRERSLIEKLRISTLI